jgi:hypothetical protein
MQRRTRDATKGLLRQYLKAGFRAVWTQFSQDQAALPGEKSFHAAFKGLNIHQLL